MSGFGIGGTNFTIENVPDVAGICNGGGVNDAPTDIVVRIPFLNQSVNPGFRV